MTELFKATQEVEDQITNQEQSGDPMQRQRNALAEMLRDLFRPVARPIILTRNGAMKELLQKAAVK